MRFLKGVLVALVCLSSLTGCAAAIVGAGGTALWQHGKIVSDEPKTLEQAKDAAKRALTGKKVTITDEVARDNFVQLRGVDKDGEKVAVDLVGTGSDSVRIEIRVGVGIRQQAKDLMLEIKKHLYGGSLSLF